MARKKRKSWLDSTTERNFARAKATLTMAEMLSVYEKNKNSTTEKITGYGCVSILLIGFVFVIFVEMNTFTWIVLAIILTFLSILWATVFIASAYIAQASQKNAVSISQRSRTIPSTVKRDV